MVPHTQRRPVTFVPWLKVHPLALPWPVSQYACGLTARFAQGFADLSSGSLPSCVRVSFTSGHFQHDRAHPSRVNERTHHSLVRDGLMDGVHDVDGHTSCAGGGEACGPPSGKRARRRGRAVGTEP